LAQTPSRYRLYIDESGDHTYNLLDRTSHRYLALLGVWFEQGEAYVRFADGLDAFKREIFGPRPDEPVILHRSDIINRKGPFGILCDEVAHGRFDEGLLRLAAEGDFKMVLVVIDKRQHLRQYKRPYHPYHYCLAAMLDRYGGWLGYKNCVGDVMAESRKGKADMALKQAYQDVYDKGKYSMFGPEVHGKVLTSRKIKIKPKEANSPGLQLADMLAYPLKQAWLAERGVLPRVGEFGKRIVGATCGKFNRNDRTGKLAGYGRVWLPHTT